MKSAHKRDACMPIFIAALFTTAKTWNQPKCPSAEEWIKKIWYIHNGVLFYHKKEQNPFISRKMNSIGEDHDQQNKSHTERHVSHILSDMWKVKNKANLKVCL
jgi:hypothetical protein